MGLATQGYAILEAPNAATALEVLGRASPDLVILDLGLPDMITRMVGLMRRYPLAWAGPEPGASR
jgi:DNA-binding response OmpR family regulator